jgi:Aspartyl protease
VIASRAAVALAVAFSQLATAQTDELPVLRATSPTVDIQDGDRLLRGIWTISPGTALDVYYARRIPSAHTVVFRSDLDSLTFEVHPGQSYDFAVVLNGRRCCHTRISTPHAMPARTVAAGKSGLDAIPFTIGADNKMHLSGRINGSAPLDLLFDLGADTAVLYPSGVRKNAGLRLDGEIENAGTGGVMIRRTSGDNEIVLGQLSWRHEPVLLIDKQSDRADGIVGNNLFDNQVVEIDYDAMELRIRDELPARANAWTALPIRFNGTLPAVPVHIAATPAPFDVQLVLDTGSSASVFLNRDLAEKYRLHESLPNIGVSHMRGTGAAEIHNQVLLLPALRLGAEQLLNLPAHVEDLSGERGGLGGHLGMDVLKRFNAVLDFRKDVAYFAPSHFFAAPYRNDFGGRRVQIAAAFALPSVVIGAFFLIRRWRRGHRRAEPRVS